VETWSRNWNIIEIRPGPSVYLIDFSIFAHKQACTMCNMILMDFIFFL
jgi:hypothetical protein